MGFAALYPSYIGVAVTYPGYAGFRFQHLPNHCMFVKVVQKEFGEEKGNSRYLHRLFPDSAVKYACLIAGLPKPPGCI
jgi:tRNA 2-thiouridine synthesizing protein E